MQSKVQKAFTLVELLILIVILGIMAAIIVPQFTNPSRPTLTVLTTNQGSQVVIDGDIIQTSDSWRKIMPAKDGSTRVFMDVVMTDGARHTESCTPEQFNLAVFKEAKVFRVKDKEYADLNKKFEAKAPVTAPPQTDPAALNPPPAIPPLGIPPK